MDEVDEAAEGEVEEVSAEDAAVTEAAIEATAVEVVTRPRPPHRHLLLLEELATRNRARLVCRCSR